MTDLTISAVIESMGVLLSTPELMVVFAHMLAVSMLIGGILDWTNKSYWLYAMTTLIGLGFYEWLRFTYLTDVLAEGYTSRPPAMAILVFLIYSGGIYIGMKIVSTSRVIDGHLEQFKGESFIELIESQSREMKRSTD